MQDESKKNLGLERVKEWLYAKRLDERSSGCVLCGLCYGHGPANPMEDVPGLEEKSSTRIKSVPTPHPQVALVDGPRASFGPDPMTPSNILAAIPGVRVVEMKRNQRWAWCCGGGGGVPEANPNLARWSATDRLRESKETGPELVLTSSALCQGSFNALEQSALRI